MGDGEVGRENRAGIAKNQVFASVKNPFLAFREMRKTKETLPLGGICFAGNHWITTPSTWSSFRIISSTFVELSNFTPASHALASIFETIYVVNGLYDAYF